MKGEMVAARIEGAKEGAEVGLAGLILREGIRFAACFTSSGVRPAMGERMNTLAPRDNCIGDVARQTTWP